MNQLSICQTRHLHLLTDSPCSSSSLPSSACRLLTKIAIFGAVACGAWLLLDLLSQEQAARRSSGWTSSATRLAARRRPRRSRGVTKRADGMARLLEKASPRLAKPLQPKTEADVGKLRAKLNYAGFRGETAPQHLPGPEDRSASSSASSLGGGAHVVHQGRHDRSAACTRSASPASRSTCPTSSCGSSRRSRQDNIFFGLPDALDLMVVCVEAGLGLDQAMRKVSEEMKKTYASSPRNSACATCSCRWAGPATKCCTSWAPAPASTTCKALAAILIQADKFGSSVAQALRVQSDSMRTRRRQMAEEKAAKTAVKLIFPLVLFIFPAIFVVLVGPAAITMINEMFPAMSGGKSTDGLRLTHETARPSAADSQQPKGG